MSPVYQRKDHYYQKAKNAGLASRAFFKFEEIDREFQVLKMGLRVMDLGCAPGGWLQYLAQKVGSGGKIVGVDLLPVSLKLGPSVKVFQGDMTQESIQQAAIEALGGKAHWVLSDMSPNLSGIRERDTYLSYELAQVVLQVAQKVLLEGGGMVVKIFPGSEFKDYQKQVLSCFEKIKTFIPQATRKGSSEVYLVAKGFNFKK